MREFQDQLGGKWQIDLAFGRESDAWGFIASASYVDRKAARSKDRDFSECFFEEEEGEKFCSGSSSTAGGRGTTETLGNVQFNQDPNGDGDMSDKVDVINMSLGAAFGSPVDPTAVTAANAVRAGVIVIGTSGNAGDVPYVSDSPGIAPGIVNVAANVPGGRIHARMSVNAPASIAGVKFNEEGSSNTRVGTPITDQSPHTRSASNLRSLPWQKSPTSPRLLRPLSRPMSISKSRSGETPTTSRATSSTPTG